MKELKKEFRWFNIMEYEKEENYLSKRHQEGWKFKRVTFPGVYTFERCEPEKVIYQLDYNKEGIKHQMEYVRMFEDCGWEYLTEFDGYNYFRKPADKMQQEEEIFCDEHLPPGYDESDFYRKKLIPLDRNSLRSDLAALYICDRP